MADFTTLTSGTVILTDTPEQPGGEALNNNATLTDAHINATGTAVHGLGTASTHAATDFDAAGAAATVNTALTNHAALTNAHSATSSNTASRIVARDSSGNFCAGTITANLTGTASNATTAASLTGNITEAQVTNLTTDLATKANMVSSPTTGHLASLTNTGDLADSGYAAASFDASGAAATVNTALTTHEAATTAHGTTGAIVGTSDAQSLTNKTIDYNSNTLLNLPGGNPFDQSLNTSDSPTFSALSTGSTITSGGDLWVDGGTIHFYSNNQSTITGGNGNLTIGQTTYVSGDMNASGNANVTGTVTAANFAGINYSMIGGTPPSGGNPFNQSLNTTDTPTFQSGEIVLGGSNVYFQPNLNLDGFSVTTGPTLLTFNGPITITATCTANAFVGDGSGLTNIPAPSSIPYGNITGAPTNVSAFTNDAGYLTSTGNPFNQSLNTSDSPIFNAITANSISLNGAISANNINGGIVSATINAVGGYSGTLNWLDGDGVTNHSLTIAYGIITAAS